MYGVFSRRPVGRPDCSLFMGVYPGHRASKEESLIKVDRYAARNAVDRFTAARKTVSYTLSMRKYDPGFVLDPTDEKGALLPEFVSYLVCYLNEPPPGHTPKAVFAYNQPRQRYEVWLLQAVRQDEEVFIYYGDKYMRDYPINDNACDTRRCHFIPAESVFRPDPRGAPAPLQVPGLDKRSERQLTRETGERIIREGGQANIQEVHPGRHC